MEVTNNLCPLCYADQEEPQYVLLFQNMELKLDILNYFIYPNIYANKFSPYY